MVLCGGGAFKGEGDALRDRWDASDRVAEVLRLAAGDSVGDGKGIKRFDVAAAMFFPRSFLID